MTTSRVSPKAGWVWSHNLPKGPNGRPLCRWCQQEIPKGSGRRTFCSDECVTEHRIRTDPGFARDQVWMRDRGVCALCGRDMDAAEQEFRGLVVSPRRYPMRELLALFNPDGYGKAGYDPMIGDRWTLPPSWWQADHIVPVIEGGGECGLDGYRTLCYRCHQRETALLAKRRAALRKGQATFDI